jgi:hypothetical protein
MEDSGASRGGDGREREGTPLPGGGVLRERSESSQENAQRPPSFSDLVHPFFLMGLASLGVVPDPESGESKVELGRAEAAIATLELLQQKTEGHLTDDERRLLEQALYELRMQYVGARERSTER